MSTLKHHVMMADHYVTLSNAAEDYAAFQFYHTLALHHLEEAHKHEADGALVEREVPELRKILEKHTP
ncbi:MAG TPA: hypothetical protein VGB82_01720 [Alphaproteobacteria bacterium]